MSQENVEIVRQGYEAWNRRDFDQLLGVFDHEIEWSFARGARLPDTDAAYHGHEGIRRLWETLIEPWEQIAVEVEDLRDGGEIVVAFVRFRAATRDGLKLDDPFTHVFTFRGSKIIRLKAYADRGEALEAAGLSE